MDILYNEQIYSELSPLIPESVENINSNNASELTGSNKTAIRPTKLDLGAPKRPARHLRPPSITGTDTSPQRSPGINYSGERFNKNCN